MLKAMRPKPILHLTGPRVGPPSLDDLIKLATALTGRQPTEAEIARAQQTLARRQT